MAQLAGEAADNNKIGYDQNQRTTFYGQLKAVGWSPSKITTSCESDCSAGVAAIAIASGHILGLSRLQSLSPDIYTGNLRSAFANAGFSVLTDSKYLTSDQYLLPGDVLLYEGHHTAINLDFGSKTMPEKLTPQKLIDACAAVYKMAHVEGFRYGDSHSLPPCADGVISCDRLIARALWDLGYTDQPQGGITVSSEKWMEPYLLKWGFKKILPGNGMKAGDIVVLNKNGQSTPTAEWHTYIATAVTVSGSVTLVNKYDMGSQERIDSIQPQIGVPVNQWANRSVYCIFRCGDEPKEDKEYVFTPADVKAGSTGASQYLANEILLSYNIKGTKKDGKLQSLELNDKWTNGDMAAMCQWKLDRIRNGDVNLCKGPYGAGEIGDKDWVSLLSSALPFHAVEIPLKESHGPSVLLAQRILKANGYKGADGKVLALDAEFGDNTAYAIKKWQKANGRPETGTFAYDDWKIILKNI